ncbi:unnamed protein product [Ilex paraguariensis]|uniref:GH18 domain-containing protein n=1 Tax=Ilex paraguariensis TaxID=185542 RepID=A0ABC8U6J4_9AQUA
MASNSASQKTFIDPSINWARSYAEAKNSSKPPLILTASVSFAPTVDGLNYPIQSISSGLNWINVMAYDFFDPTRSKFTNSHAALYDSIGQVSASYGIGAWIQAGITAKKLVLGMPFYGYSRRLVNANNHGVLAPANGLVGSDMGAITYHQIKAFITQNKATTVYNATIVSDYCYAGTTWIGYDDKQITSTKVSYAKQKGLLGYFAWRVAADYNWGLSQQGLCEFFHTIL